MRDRDDILRSTPIKGSNQTKVRGYNERLVLHLIRTHRALTKAEATRATGLSPNAVSTIFRALEADGLLLRDAPIRGRVGQPSVPMRLNPAARHYLGVKIGRRSLDIAVVDFTGRMVARRSAAHAYPTPEATRAFLRANLRPLLRSAKLKSSQIDGSGIAMPSELWHWAEDFGAPRDGMAAWRGFDVVAELGPSLPGPLSLENDGTAACRAELVFGPVSRWQDVVYFFVGTFIGGGIMLNGSVYPGRRGNSGGFGPLRIPDEPGGTRLVDHASLAVLESLAANRGRAPFTSQGHDWSALEPTLSDWIARAARSLAHAIVSTLSVIDFEAVVIDGALPVTVRDRLVRTVGRELDQIDLQGVGRPDLGPGHLGDAARVLGAAAYWISTECMIDQNARW
ncbi:MAG: ROK family transcriptional regulator [Paracoccaceae bacterium]|jgi:predicted NBD/HSP70 family sugar kinase|nr:ROK family transcriptional regulator [Paracoccaceae bacterium]